MLGRYIPSELGYGDSGSPPKIKGGDPLVFQMEIIKIKVCEQPPQPPQPPFMILLAAGRQEAGAQVRPHQVQGGLRLQVRPLPPVTFLIRIKLRAIFFSDKELAYADKWKAKSSAEVGSTACSLKRPALPPSLPPILLPPQHVTSPASHPRQIDTELERLVQMSVLSMDSSLMEWVQRRVQVLRKIGQKAADL